VPVRPATAADRPAIAAMLARAFYDDPVFEWFLPNQRRRLAQARRVFAGRTGQLVPQEQTYVAETDGRIAAAALWALPGRWHTTLTQDVMAIVTVLPAVVHRFGELAHGFRRMEAGHPETPPHLYLAIVGTDPAQQGRGLGGAVMRPGLDLCDREGLPAYLEASKHRNIRYYARFGFRETDAITLGTGPTIYGMWREPR
jgi:GNAT superfamily N-acetyltransferase